MKDDIQKSWDLCYAVAYACLLISGKYTSPAIIDTAARHHADQVTATFKERSSDV